MKIQNIIGAVFILCGLALLWFFTDYGFGNFAAYAGQALGQSMVIVLILLLLLAVTPLRKKVTLLLVIGVVWFGSAGLMSFELYEKGVAERKAAETIVELLDSVSSGKQIILDNEASNNETVIAWMKGYISRVQKIHLEFSNKINASGLGEMLAPENLANSERAKQAKIRITHLERSVADYESRILKELMLAENILSKRKDSSSQAAYRGFMETKQKGVQNTKRYFEIEQNIISTIDDILDLSISLAGQLHLQSGQLLFEDKKSLDLYNGYLARITTLSAQEKNILNEQQQGIENTKRKINGAL